MRFGVIGRAGHGSRIIDILKTRSDVTLSAVYHPRESKGSLAPNTSDFAKILACDAVVIASPNQTHFSYLELLKSFPGHILIEKPAVSSQEQTLMLKKFDAEFCSRLKVNFNYRYSAIAHEINELLKSGSLGLPIAMRVHTSHGLAFEANYHNSWRASWEQTLGPFEMVGVHFINLAMMLFGQIQSSSAHLFWKAGYKEGLSPDTGVADLTMQNGVCVNLFHSYAAPYANYISIVGTDGIWEYDGKTSTHCGPRDCKDSNGRFTSPPIIKSTNIDFSADWKDSLSRSVLDFVESVKNNRRFDRLEFEQALSSMDPIFYARQCFLDNLKRQM